MGKLLCGFRLTFFSFLQAEQNDQIRNADVALISNLGFEYSLRIPIL